MRKIKIFLLALVLFLASVREPVFAENSKEVIKVGCIEQCGFLENSDGEYRGYAVDYLEEIGEYTGWEYEYVFDTWENCLKKLETGEVQLVCMAQYDKTRAEKFLYADMPFGSEYTVLYTREDSDIYFEDYGAMAGCRVGVLRGSKNAEEFFDYAEENELACEPVFYDTEHDIFEALRENEIELAAVGSLHRHSEFKIVGRCDVRPVYCITGKGNTDLMEELNRAMQQIKIESPGLENSLSEKYYGSGTISCSPLFTREEHEYIETSDPIVIKLMLGTRPLAYERDGEPVGIFLKYLDLISEASGLEFTVEETTAQSFDEQTRQIINGEYVTLRAKRAIDAIGLDEQLTTTKPLIETKLAYIKRLEDAEVTGRTDYIFAITKEMTYLPPMLLNSSADYEIKYYDTPKECLDAVLNKEADIAIQDSYVMNYWLKKPAYTDKLVEAPGKEVVNNMCLVASRDQQVLVQIINKTIDYISEEEIKDAVTLELIAHPYEKSWFDVLYEYWQWLLFIGIIVVVAIMVYTILLRRMTTLQVQKKEYEKLQKKVQQDELTGVYNRPYFYKKAKEMINNAEEDMCIVLMDISNFKVVNDLYGMENGDRLLKQVAGELKKLLEGKNAIVGRFTGDHFYMCMTEKNFYEIKFPKRFHTFLEEMEITVSYGVFRIKEKKDVPVNIMCDRASLAVHDEAQNRMEYIRYYNDEERKRILEAQEIENEMEKALEQKQFCVYIQPKYDISKEEVVGGEALVRWIHPQKGMIPPGVFISIFEKNGFIVRLDYFVWEETCRLLAELRQQGGKEYPVSINVSRVHFYGVELQEKLEELIAKYRLKPQDLELEITETICAEDPEIIYGKIRALQKAGFKVAMDDFGSGYSSLNMLKEMPLDIIKMDLKFLDGGDNEEKSRYILQTLIALAQNMQLDVVVEGVETKEQVEFLKETGNFSVQGYYFSKPVPDATYKEMLLNC